MTWQGNNRTFKVVEKYGRLMILSTHDKGFNKSWWCIWVGGMFGLESGIRVQQALQYLLDEDRGCTPNPKYKDVYEKGAV